MRPARGAVIALGNFDGFHLGHQAVVGRAIALARAEGRPALVATFSPHPARLFKPDSPPFLLTGVEQRIRLFKAFGADDAVAIPFDRALAALTPEDFVARWLKDELGAAAVITGADFNFGRGRAGDAHTLRTIGARHGIAAEAVTLVEAGSAVASSTRIRQHLAAGEIDAASRLLGRPHRIEGVVRSAMVNGRPTAAITLDDYLRPRAGRYAIRVRFTDGRTMPGIAGINDPGKAMLTLQFPDPPGDFHGQTIGVDLVSHLDHDVGFRRPVGYSSRMPAVATGAASCNL